MIKQFIGALAVVGTLTTGVEPTRASHDLEEAYTQVLVYGIPMAGAVLIPVNGVLLLTGHPHKGGAYLAFAASATELGSGIYALTSEDGQERLLGGLLLGLAAGNGALGGLTLWRANQSNAQITPGVITPAGYKLGFSMTGEF